MTLELFGQIDQTNISPVGDFEDGSIVFDCFQATQRIKNGNPPRADATDAYLDKHYPVFAFSITRKKLTKVLVGLQLLDNSDDRWFRLILKTEPGSGQSVDLAGLYDESAPRFRLVEANIAEDPLQEALNKIVNSVFQSWRTSINKVESLISKALRNSTKLDVSVVDVGQGSLAALHAPEGRPVLFFDLGWPTFFNSKSAPKLKPKLSNDRVPVILSHWDWDHWALAIEKAGWNKKKGCWSISWSNLALNRPWLVPGSGGKWGDVKLGPIHWRLALALAKRKKLYRWPASCAQKDWNLLTVYRTGGGKLKDRNQHGLVMVIDNTEMDKRTASSRRAILLPGDADYVNLPPLLSTKQYDYCGLVATHHGAKFTRSGSPKAAGPAWLAYSVGEHNSYGHPRRFAQYRYIRAGWTYQAHTSHRVAPAGAAPVVATSGSVLLTTEKVRVLPATASGASWLGNQ